MNPQTDRFRRLIEPHLATLTVAALRLTGSATEADDLLQETLLKAYRHLHTLTDETNQAGWLYTVMKNSFLNSVRQKSRRPLLMNDPNRIERVAANDSTDEGIDDTLQAALMSLPDDQRAMLVAREIEGLSYQEIADRHDLPLGTVKSRVNRGREALRRAWFEKKK